MQEAVSNYFVSSVDDISITAELAKRPARLPDYQAESYVLGRLGQEMASAPETALQKITEFALKLCRAESAGITILEPNGDFFRLHAVAGLLASCTGNILPRESSCGIVIAQKQTALFKNGPLSVAINAPIPPVHEQLFVPWFANGEAVGTLWIAAHEAERKFDAEDARLLENLAQFASAAYQMITSIQKAKTGQQELERHVEITTRELLHADERLSESEIQFRRALDIGTVGVLLFNLDEHIGDANEAFQRMSGYSHEELLNGVHWETLTPPEFRDVTHHATEELATKGETTPYEKQLIRKDGTRWWGLFAPRRLTGSGASSKCVEFVIDITEHKEVEAALIEARNAAEAANIAKTEFLTNMSHEIRTPMNAVVGLSNILSMNEKLSAREKEYVKVLQASAGQLMSLINDMLDMSRIESSAFELEKVSFNPVKLIRECIDIVSVTAQKKKLSVTVEQNCPRDGEFVGDPLRVQQIIMNLLSNAVKFTERGGIAVKVDLLFNQQQPNLVQLEFSVRDTGIGMDSKTCGKIFGKFTQADSSITRKYGGTGLGLTISKKLAELMDGDITVESEPGVGTEFKFIVPLLVEPSIVLHAEANDNGKKTMSNPLQEENAKILLVEDYEANVFVATTILESFGYGCDVARSGREAIQILSEKKFDLVLMDVQMPDLDGLETTRLIRIQEKQEKCTPVPIIAMTAHALTGDKEKCMNAGMTDYISKPFDPDLFQNMVRKYLGADSLPAACIV